MPEFTKVWSVANIALIKLTAKLASSVHIVQSSRLLCEVPWSYIDPGYSNKGL